MERMRLPSDVLRRITFAVIATLLALGAIALTAVRATREATRGADRVESEFAERVGTDAALLAATENLDLVELRLRAATAHDASRLDARLSASDAKLAQAISTTIDPRAVRPAEAAVVHRVRTAYAGYLTGRGVLVSASGDADAAQRNAAADRVRQIFAPIRKALTDYAGVHFAEANRNLQDLRQAGRGRNWVLVLTLTFGALSLLAIALVAHGIVGRVRSYGTFAQQVASGDLDARLKPAGQDELTGLGHNLNSMVEQLSAADRERRAMHEEEADFRAGQDSFSELLQVTESEHEAHLLLTRHIERSVPRSTVVILNRNEGQERLEAATPLPLDSPLREPLAVAQPRSCLAVRLARTHQTRVAVPAMLECEICGATGQDSTCAPLLVRSEVIGAVLVEHAEPLEPLQERRIHDSVALAAPVFSNLRTLALAEHRAATDALTGLPNRRAAQDELRRMMAQAARRQTSLAAIMLDLDHFKPINDTYGHECGDAVLAAVGIVLATHVRASDFVGRVGGEEFLILLPDTLSAAALEVAEKLRAAVATIAVSGVDRPITASFGVALHPDAAADADALLRAADRAMYAAKTAGRNRVELATQADAAPVGIGEVLAAPEPAPAPAGAGAGADADGRPAAGADADGHPAAGPPDAGVPAPTAGNGAPDRGAGRAPARPRRRFAPRPGAPMPAEQEPGPSGPPEPRG